MQVACALVAALLQYFFLAAFCWMLCEGIYLFLILVVVFSTLPKKWWLFLLIGWGKAYIAMHISSISILITILAWLQDHNDLLAMSVAEEEKCS